MSDGWGTPDDEFDEIERTSSAEREGEGWPETADGTIDYTAVPIPSDKEPSDYAYPERRAEIYRLIERAGHPHNLERSQAELGERFGVSQRMISKDIQVLREFEAEHNQERTKSITSWLAEKAVMDAIEKENFEKALKLQMTYNEFLMDSGLMDQAASQLQIEGNAGDAYMQMLREAHAEENDRQLDGANLPNAPDEEF